MVEKVAELSGNHGGSLDRMLELIEAAAWAGCDYAKFQFYRPGDMPDRYEGNNDVIYRRLMVPDHWLDPMFTFANKKHIGLFASVFSVRAVETLLKFDAPFIKIASPDSTPLDHETVREIIRLVPADVGIISSCSRARAIGNELYCPLGHPPTITQKDFRTFRRGNFYGFSDHTPGIHTPLAFIRAGARMIEKHLKLSSHHDCIDKAFSATPDTMKTLCKLAHTYR